MAKRLTWHIHKRYVVELFLIILFALFATRAYQNFDPALTLPGIETQYLTNSAVWLEVSLREYGYIPYWQPYLDRGQPSVAEAYSFLLNPFSFYPIAGFGAANGLKISVILSFIVVGSGGWFLGWSLGWSSPARLLLGGLLILKGTMQGDIGTTYYQLGISQAFFPWVFAGAMAVVCRPKQRWPLVLLAVAVSLTYFSGNIYHTLSVILITLLVWLAYGFSFNRKTPQLKVDIPLFRRFLFAGAITLGITAVSTTTAVLYYGLARGHQDALFEPTRELLDGLQQFVNSTPSYPLSYGSLYSYSAPLWFVIFFLILFPPIKRFHRPASSLQGLRFGIMLLAGFVLFFTWGTGENPILKWMYENLPLIARWRYLERMFAVAAFYLIVLLAYRVDGLYRALLIHPESDGESQPHVWGRYAVRAGIFALCGLAIWEVHSNRFSFNDLWLHEPDRNVETCVRWLRQQHPDEFLSVRRLNYDILTVFIEQQIRKEQIGAAYDLGGVTSTLYPYDLTRLLPEYYIVNWSEPPDDMRARGYLPIEESPQYSPEDPMPCVWYYPDAVSYAFSIPVDDLQRAPFPLTGEMTTPVMLLRRAPDIITLEATPSADLPVAVVAQDIAYPGWVAKVNGEPAQLESVGELLGVILPPGEAPVLVEFEYTAPTLKIGGVITLFTAFLCVVYLLRLDTIPRRIRMRRNAPRMASTAATTSLLPESDNTLVLLPAEISSDVVKIAPTLSYPTAAKPTVIRTIKPIQYPDHAPHPTLEIHVPSGRHRVVLPPSDEPLVVEVVVEKPRWSGLNAAISILFAGLIGANAVQWLSSMRRKRHK